jgi:hypothetical protein
MQLRSLALLAAAALAGCAGAEHGNSPAARATWLVGLRGDPAEFALSGRREIRVIYSLVNSSRQMQQLDFPTSQKLEVTMRGPDGANLFQWSEDRQFAPMATAVVVNPGERLEYEAAVPTRDMVSGRVYTLEAVLPGYPETVATAELRPR